MKNFFFNLLTKLGLSRDNGAPVHNGINPVFFTNVYASPDGTGFTFSWRSADHSFGGVFDTFQTLEDANNARALWSEQRVKYDRATFVHESA